MCPICTTTGYKVLRGTLFLSAHSCANLLLSLPHKFANPCSMKTSFPFLLATDEPKPPGPVELEQVVYGKVIITWAPSPDQEKDDRMHYLVEERDSNTRVWRTIADRLFCNTYTASVHSGREYHFRVYAKNDMGFSDPSKSPTWGINELRGERLLENTNKLLRMKFLILFNCHIDNFFIISVYHHNLLHERNSLTKNENCHRLTLLSFQT